ncbi:MAG: carbohydrate binding domain-containing protein, partial [Planctomycetota bacterium]
WASYGTGGHTIEVVQSGALSGKNTVLIDITDASLTTSIGIFQGISELVQGQTYPLGFIAKSDQEREMTILIQLHKPEGPTQWNDIVWERVQLTTEPQEYVLEYTHNDESMADNPGWSVNMYLMLKGPWHGMAGSDLNTKVWIDRVYFGAEPEVEDLTRAMSPDPADGEILEDTWFNLRWVPGDFAVSHDVYLGENLDDVNDGAEGTFIGNQLAPNLVIGFPGVPYPDGLVNGVTYFWRIDEVNDAEPNSPWKGDVWSFSIPHKTAYQPDPADGADSVDVNVELSWTVGFGAKLHTIYFGENFDDVNNASGGIPQGNTTYTPDTLKQAKTYYWRIDEFDIVETHKGNVWSFTTEGAVTALDPANGAVDVSQTPVLTWAPGLGASHEVYFGADEASLELKGSGNLGSESYEPGQLEWNTTYYWRVDEVNNANADSPWTGPLWSFTTANFLIIDDMESYNDIDPAEPGSNNIFYAWIDGYDNPTTNGSVVGNPFPPYAEQTIVHSGNQSMPMLYDNTVGKSEATLTLTSDRDWTVNGINTLTIWFRGEVDNAAEQMYVTLNGNARVDHDDPDAATRDNWTRWNIDLQAFGVNLANVNSITLGLSSVSGGSGKMYYDDIRLYALQP